MKKKLISMAMVIASSATFGQIGIQTSNPQGIFHVDGAKDNPASGLPSAIQRSNDFIITSKGDVGIGTITPNASAILELNVNALSSGSKKGFLGPRVALLSNTDNTTIPSPATGLLVYNTGTSGLPYKGYVFWNGTEWRSLKDTTTAAPKIAGLNCSNAVLAPDTYTAGQPYSGTLTIPYSGGNGGLYAGGSPISSTGVTGLSATLQPDNLAFGNGYLTYNVSGTPNQSSPATATFAIPGMFGASGCSATVGGDTGSTINVGQSITAVYSIPNATASTSSFNLGNYVNTNNLTPLPMIDGLQINLQGVDNTFYDPRIYNRASKSQVISYQTFATQVNENETNLNNTLASNAFLKVDANDIVYWTTTLAEVITSNIQVQVNATTYRWYEFKWWCMEVGPNKKIFLSITRKA